MALLSRVIHDLDHSMPAAHKSQLGTTLDNALTALAELQTQYAALLVKLDAAGVAGGTNASTVGLQTPVVGPLGSRKAAP